MIAGICYLGSQVMPLIFPFPKSELPVNFSGTSSSYSGRTEMRNSQQYEAGKRLFTQNCARCHSPALENDMTGPALLYVLYRVPSREWLIRYIKDAGKMLKEGDPYATQLHAKWKVEMDPMPLSDEEINTILAFIEQYPL